MSLHLVAGLSWDDASLAAAFARSCHCLKSGGYSQACAEMGAQRSDLDEQQLTLARVREAADMEDALNESGFSQNAASFAAVFSVQVVSAHARDVRPPPTPDRLVESDQR